MAWIESSRRTSAVCTLPVWRLLGVCALALTTANCANAPQRLAGASGSDIDPKYGVRASRRLYAEGEAIPKGGGRRFSGKPYVVAGRTYVPREDARGYVRDGLASWYGSAFHGRMTANGEVFDRHSIAAAHPTLPLPSYARVTNLENGYSMVVRVNDRGPYHANRVMDVSEEAARALDFQRKGTAHVRVEYIGKASTAGSDDRKLLATLRTDGRPTGAGPHVMVADLGPDAAPDPERFAKPARPALAFKQTDGSEGEAEGEGTREAAPAQRPLRPASVVVASAPAVAVPSAVQPTAARSAPFRPQTVSVAGLVPARAPTPRNAPLSLAPPPIRLASAGPERSPLSAAKQASLGAPAMPRPANPSPMPASRVATIPTPMAMPSSAKLAMARLAASAAPASPKSTAPSAGKAAARRSRVAEVY